MCKEGNVVLEREILEELFVSSELFASSASEGRGVEYSQALELGLSTLN